MPVHGKKDKYQISEKAYMYQFSDNSSNLTNNIQRPAYNNKLLNFNP